MSQISIRACRKAGDTIAVSVDHFPDRCGICDRGVEVKFITAYALDDKMQAIFQCPTNNCESYIIGYYYREFSNVYRLLGTEPMPSFHETEFSNEITNLSPSFVAIFNQSLQAEQTRLDQLVGPGLRKSLEYLVKDYAISANPESEDKIRVMFLGTCINEYLKDANIHDCAERAAWLGNDHTHFEVRYSGHDIQDLKRLIRLTVNWIENSLLTNQYREELTKTPR